ncbi:hypothetical protein O0L34_g16300 [Tuta absoluta]|nr:hypothetical protein O0L34_g16300 [Tuta absoluta]
MLPVFVYKYKNFPKIYISLISTDKLEARRNMWRLASCLLLAVTSLDAHRSHSRINPETYATSGAVYPIDYNDELVIKNPLVHPDANIIFSFSQTRRDQPPQLDNREERLGKYMYRRRSFTTTTTSPTPPPAESKTVESESGSDESGETVEVMFDPIVTTSQPEDVPEKSTPEPTETQPAHQQAESVPDEKKSEEASPVQHDPDSTPMEAKSEPRHIHPTRSHPEGILMGVKHQPMRTQPAHENPEIVPKEIKPEPVHTARRHHGRAQTRPVMLPTGSTTGQPIYSFHDFDSDLEVPDSSRIDPAARYPSVDIWQPRTKTTLPPFFTQSTTTMDLKHLVLPQVTEEAPRMNTSHRRHKPRHGTRDDVMWAVTASPVVPTVPAVVPTVVPKLGNPPPPVPTLSPWYGDEFGK